VMLSSGIINDCNRGNKKPNSCTSLTSDCHRAILPTADMSGGFNIMISATTLDNASRRATNCRLSSNCFFRFVFMCFLSLSDYVMSNKPNSATPDVRCQPRMRN
jgi:hypothetical protein